MRSGVDVLVPQLVASESEVAAECDEFIESDCNAPASRESELRVGGAGVVEVGERIVSTTSSTYAGAVVSRALGASGRGATTAAKMPSMKARLRNIEFLSLGNDSSLDLRGYPHGYRFAT
ncbi:MAG: hypothetical protein ABR543_05825 [Gemmatimonadaceae bacterium]